MNDPKTKWKHSESIYISQKNKAAYINIIGNVSSQKEATALRPNYHLKNLTDSLF